MKRLLMIACCLIACLGGLMAQSVTIVGKVIDSDGIEVIGGNVAIKGAAGVGTITDLDGKYTLAVKDAAKAILVFSYIGMESQEIAVKGRSVIDVKLKPSNLVLDEVVVIGYGTAKRGDLTGSVVSVKSDDLMKVPTSDVTQALAGRVAGVQVTQSEGAPGASVSIRVRGGISITQSNEPLYIIDGFPSEDGMSTIDPADIESIDILKDASATAIYGARGANGVVVITTKKGGKGEYKMTVSFDSYIGIKKVAKKLPVLSTEEFVLLDYERSFLVGEAEVDKFQSHYGSFLEIDRNYGNRRGVDWQDEVLGRTATSQNYRLKVSGGGKELKYSLGYTYFKDLGAMVHSGNDKHILSFNVTHKASDLIEVNARVNYDQTKVYGMGTSENTTRFNKMEHILQYRPTYGIHGSDEDLLLGEDPTLTDDEANTMQNPLISAAEETNEKIYRTLQINGGFTLNFNKQLSFRNSTGMRYQNVRNDVFNGDQSIIGMRASIGGSIRYTEASSFQISNVLNYKNKFGVHDLAVMLGQEWVSRRTRYVQASATNFPSDDIGLGDMSLGIPGTVLSNVNNDDKLLSFFTRVNYNIGDKYLLTATLRADGSSKFSADNKWGIFPSISGAWRMGEETFVKNLNVFSDLKLRMGYGMAGNNRIASYQSLELLGSVGYPNGDSTVPGYSPSNIPSKDLKWESNKTFNFGLDFGFLHQRLIISPEFYLNKSDHLLLNSRVPSSSGYTNMMRNIGKTKNVGFDLTISSTNIQKDNFTWATNFNISHNRNTIEALSGEQFFLEEASFGYGQKTHKVEVGKSIGQFYGYKTIGLYQVEDFNYDAATRTYLLKEGIPCMGNRNLVKPGMWKFANTDGNEVIDEKDMTVIGNANPDFYGGLNNTFNYKNFDLSVFFTFSCGGEVLNATKLTNTKAGFKNKNVLDVANSADRWMTIGADGLELTDPEQLATINRGKTVAAVYDMEEGDKYIHSWAVEDASFLRLSNVTLGYNFPKKWIQKAGIRSLRFYATGSNLFVWTPYSGFDPEVSTKGSNLTPGVDFGAYPRSRSYVFGINITL